MDKTTDMAQEKEKDKVEFSAEEKLEEQLETAEEEVEVKVSEEDVKEEDSSEEKEETASDSDSKYKELNDKYVRLYAEFENFRRRSAREAMETHQNASVKLIEKLLPTLLDFERAFNANSEGQAKEDFKAGIKMIFNNFKDVLEDAGLEEINPEGEEFDPNLHEALMQQFHDTVEEDHIVQVFEKGFKVNSKIIKHAKVITSKGKEG